MIAERNLRAENFDEIANEFLDKIAKQNQFPKTLTAQAFREWCLQKMGKPFLLLDVGSALTAPKVGKNMTYLNRISAIVGKVRDRSIVSAISNELNQANRVLIIYGGSHFMTQSLAIEDLLGRAVVEKLF